MADTDWRMKGRWLKNCNCAPGCPCDFNQKPTYGPCEGMAGMRIDEGHFGDVPLDGLSWMVTYHWPGPLHEGGGTMQAVIDEQATEAQRNALMSILGGQESAEGTIFHIFTLIVENNLTPLFLPIGFEFDMASRRAKVSVPGVFETESSPIINPVTGEEHRILVRMPEGFEHKEAEIASARTTGVGEIKFDIEGGHSTLSEIEHYREDVRDARA